MTVYVDYPNISVIQMEEDEIAYIVEAIKNMHPKGLMVEWGSGGSTLRWLETLSLTQSLISIEHHSEWYKAVTGSVKEYFADKPLPMFTYLLREVVDTGYFHEVGNVSEENPWGLKDYVYPGEIIRPADIYFVDGLARGACISLILLKRYKPDSRIFIHDYSWRLPAYNWISQMCDVKLVGTTLAELTFKKD